MPFLRYEHRRQPLLPPQAFLRRLASHGAMALVVIAGALGIGIAGYRTTEGMSWLDAYLNAAMILGGMGPVGELRTSAGKVFAGTYALFSGIVFLVVAGVLFAPLAHRLMHRLHLEDDADAGRERTSSTGA
jgi:hypothetical protein